MRMRCSLLLPMCEVSVCQFVRQSVWHADNSASLCKNGRTDQDAAWGEYSCRGTWNIVLDGVADPPQRGKGDISLGSPRISGTAAARDLKFSVLIEGWGP